MQRASSPGNPAAGEPHLGRSNPQAKVKGNRLPFGGLSNATDPDDVVAYLKTLK